MKHFLFGIVLLIIMGCHASRPPRGTSACNSVASILGNPLACEGSDLVVPGHLTFTRHGIFMADEAEADLVLSAFLSQAPEHAGDRQELIALVRAQPPSTTRTLVGKFKGRLVVTPSEKPRMEVFSAMELAGGDD